jgi:tetratricopeptide (TPR) repeat protein
MKKFMMTVVLIGSLLTSQAQLRTPAPSPLQTIKQDFGLGNIEISYSRPAMKGRKIFGDLVPYGNVWRTGANSATTLQFSDEVTIGGVKLAPGKYGLLSIPNKDSWTLIISKQTDVTSPAAYKQDMDVVRVNAPVTKAKGQTENFMIQVDNIKSTQCQIELCWDQTKVAFTVETDVDTRIMQQITTAMQSEKPPYFNAAMYFMDNGKDLNQALSWFEKAAAATPTAYWVQHQLANCLAKLGKKAEAKAAAQKSRELALAVKNMDYVKLNDKLLAELK